MADLPTSWADEPWPLEEPVSAPVFRPRNWSDSHADAPQVADLADDAQALVDRYGMSMERALVLCQHRQHVSRFAGAVGRSIAAQGAAGALAGAQLRQSIVDAMTQEQLDRARRAAGEMWDAMVKVAEVFNTSVDQMAERLQAMGQQFKELEVPERRRPQPACPTHGLLAKGGFCRRCSRSSR